MRDFIFYIRDEKGFPIACVAAVKGHMNGDKPDAADRVAIGISVHNPKDRYDRALGRGIALGRAKALFDRRPGAVHNLAFWAYDIDLSDLKADGAKATICANILEVMTDGHAVLPARVVKAVSDTVDNAIKAIKIDV